MTADIKNESRLQMLLQNYIKKNILQYWMLENMFLQNYSITIPKNGFDCVTTYIGNCGMNDNNQLNLQLIKKMNF